MARPAQALPPGFHADLLVLAERGRAAVRIDQPGRDHARILLQRHRSREHHQAFTDRHNARGKRFIWAGTAQSIIDKIQRLYIRNFRYTILGTDLSLYTPHRVLTRYSFLDRLN